MNTHFQYGDAVSAMERTGEVDLISQRVAKLLQRSRKFRRRGDRAHRRQFARLLKDQRAVDVTVRLTDEVIRIVKKRDAAKRFRQISKDASIHLGLLNYLGIKFASLATLIAPGLVISAVTKKVRSTSKRAILGAESKRLRRHLIQRKGEKVANNINVLGEAVLGEAEATARFESVVEMLSRDEVNYVSVKVSSIISQIVTIDTEGSITRVSERMRILYRLAMKKNAFVNLDMEEFRDLEITVTLFQRILDESEFHSLSAGIVIQAYLPDSHHYFDRLATWARDRKSHGGGVIKIRLVKGANLAMEKAEAEYHGHLPATYPSKADVDASYLKLIDTALTAANKGSLRIGIASHNLFHIVWALELASARGLSEMIDIEMLEGMANGEALAVAEEVGSVLLYTPVTKKSDFPSAVAYLVRRLDENTSAENYLRASFSITPGSREFLEQRDRFATALASREGISTQSIRHHAMGDSHHGIHQLGKFVNQSDGDLTDPIFKAKLVKAFKGIQTVTNLHIPLMIGGDEVLTSETEEGSDPNLSDSAEKKIWYHYSIADRVHIDRAIRIAKRAQVDWDSLGAQERGVILYKAAEIMESSRSQTISIMARDTGKTVAEADPEISEAIDFARYYASTSLAACKGSTPMGIVVIVPPWNFPYAIPLGGVLAALAAGNSVIFKPAPESVAVAWSAVNHLWQAGVPKEVLHFVPTRDDDNGKYLITHDEVNAVILTGGFETARLFLSWDPGMTLLAETSGKNAIVVTASADIDLAVKDLIHSAFSHAGQKCSAASLAIVDQSIHDHPSFIRQLKDAASSLVVGPGTDFSTLVGPVIRKPEGALSRALTQLDDGESWLVEPELIDPAGQLWRPGIKIGVKPGSWSHLNEWFGPVLAIMRAPDLSSAIEWQNSTPYGLTAGIHSLNEEECEEWLRRVEAGNLYINRAITGAVVQRQPFGGWKRSSVGPTSKAGGPHYIEQLRNWPLVLDAPAAQRSAQIWWERTGSKVTSTSTLTVERNYLRYRKYSDPILVRVDASTSHAERLFISWLTREHGIKVVMSDNESQSDFLDFARNNPVAKVRWLSGEIAPTSALIDLGISIDSRPLTQAGAVEMTRWLREQSISITHHRYGNVGGGPNPEVRPIF
ncbi:MAG: bifunctional proline dehydrogenase/L-glutamate gamma-semialdehyde dehydrogenase [Candidatus Nanopelagicaceae bacterium]